MNVALMRSHGVVRLLVAALSLLALLPVASPLFAGTAAAQEGGTATITVRSYLEDGVTPLPFVRFQITDSNGNLYDPLETAPPEGAVTFTVAADGATSYELVAETPPACAVQPDPVAIDPLEAGAETSVDVSVSFLQDCNLGSVSIYAYDCPDGIEAGGADYATYSGACTETIDGRVFQIAEQEGEDAWDVVTGEYGISGRAPLVGLVPGNYIIQNTTQNPDEQFVVFCLTYEGVPDGSSTPDSVEPAELAGDGVLVELAGNRVACDFFAVPANGDEGEAPAEEEPQEEQPSGDDGGGAVEEGDVDEANAFLEVHLVACEPGYAGSDFFNDCHDNGIEGQTVTIEGPGGYVDSLETVLSADPGPGVAYFDGLAGGEYKVSEDVPGDTATYYAYCSMADSDEAVPFEYDDSTSEAIVLTLEAGTGVVCDFYIVPIEQQTEEPEAEEPVQEGDGADDVQQGSVDDATLEVHLVACPAGYGGGNFFEDCHDNGIEGRTITVEGPGGLVDSKVTVQPVNPGPGIAFFDGLAAGVYKVSEDIPGDTATYYAYCSLANSQEVVPFEYDDSTSEAIVFEIEEGADIVCDFYIVPDQQFGPGKITVTKRTCEPGYGSDAIFDLLEDCPEVTEGVTFTLSPHSGGGDVDKTTNENGRVRYSGLAPGDYDLWEDVPGEFSTPVVWCNVAGGDWYQKSVSASDSVTFDVDENDDIRCAWFNIPEDLSGGGSLEIHKSLCPPGLTSGFFESCHEDPLADVAFVADGPGGYEAELTTGDEGIVVFEDLNAGTYTITEIPPADPHVAVYVVYCSRDGEPYNFTYDDSTGLRIVIKIPAGGQVVCDWYNVPPAKPQPGAEGSITVFKFLCEGRSNNKYAWADEDECDSYGAGAEFSLTRLSNGAVFEGATAANGKLIFANLPDGAYALDETSGDWCHAEADHVDASGNVKVIDGGNTNVYIYNCSRPVDELPSTGVGPMSGPVGPAGMTVVWGMAGLFGLVVLRRARRPKLQAAPIRRAA